MTDRVRRAMEPKDLTRIKFVSDPRLSPDGRQVAFVVTTLSDEKDEYLSNIWIVDVGGGEPRHFTTGPKRDTSPRWSPDGSTLAFVSERESGKKPQLYLMPVRGGEPRRLTDLKNGVSSPVWSPDGSRLAFLSRVGGWEEPESDEEKQKSKPPQIISVLKYRYNGEGFIHERHPHLYVVSTDGGEPKQITNGDYAVSDPTWSPTEDLIAFVAARHPERDYDNASDVWGVSSDGGEPRQITDTAGPVGSPAFSPDGKHIAFVGHRYRDEAGRNHRLFVVSLESATPTCLTPDLDRNVTRLVWTRGGSSVAFAVDDHGDVPVYLVESTGGNAPPERVIDGDGQVVDLSTDARGETLAFSATDPISPPDLFVGAANGGERRQLTDLNRAWKDEVALGRPERFHFQRAGFELDGWIVKPFGFEEGKPYPALLNIHGGPATQYGHNFFDEFQVYAGAGYVVIYTNPRGSQGYGEEFTRAVIGDWGGGDFEDVMGGLDEALRRYDFIDPNRLGVMGGSYGGYLTSWSVGHTDRFKAACSERALNTFVSFTGTSDIGPHFAPMYSGYQPWENSRWYVDHSPLSYASQINTPLLIIHSEQDLRCPIEQAEQLFALLKMQRKEALLVRFPDENHEMSRSGRPRHRLERFRIILDWFGKYLG
jgi:dipeptidyl aminopeptidase/acylaminoacyl peptidase